MHEEHQLAKMPGLTLSGRIDIVWDQQICGPGGQYTHLTVEVPSPLIEEVRWLSVYILSLRHRMYLIVESEYEAVEIEVLGARLHQVVCTVGLSNWGELLPKIWTNTSCYTSLVRVILS